MLLLVLGEVYFFWYSIYDKECEVNSFCGYIVELICYVYK